MKIVNNRDDNWSLCNKPDKTRILFEISAHFHTLQFRLFNKEYIHVKKGLLKPYNSSFNINKE